jgi:hypothetical protein
MLHELAFQVVPYPRLAGQPLQGPIHAAVHPLVDGKRLDAHGRYFFDVGLILALRTHPAAPVDFFTCTCGVAGCVGIHESSELLADESTVAWRIPTGRIGVQLEFPTSLAGELTAQLTFDRQQYEKALDDLVSQLKALSAQNGGRAVDIWGDRNDEVSQTVSLEERIAADHLSVVAFYSHEAWRREAFGDLLSSELDVHLPNGYIAAIPLENLAYLLTSGGRRHLEVDDRAHIEAVLVPAFRLGADAVGRMVRAQPWPVLMHEAFRSGRCPSDIEIGEHEGAADWPAVRFSLVAEAH